MPGQSHFTPRDIDCGGETGRVYWATEPSGDLVVFVHGFAGSATDTWMQFPSMLQAAATCDGADIVFYEYETFKKQVSLSAGVLRQFLDKLMSDSAAVVNASVDADALRPAGFAYKRLVLVAHSMGAVVARLALVQAYRSRAPWFAGTRLVLFAPAHCGARISRLALDATTGFSWLKLGIGAAEGYFPPLGDLKPGSAILTQLLDDTVDAVATGDADPLIAAKIIQGLDDRVVEALRFAGDPVAWVEPKKGHQSVCKPDPDYRKPVDEVVGQLQ